MELPKNKQTGRILFLQVIKIRTSLNEGFPRNIVLYLTQFWFCLFNGFSGQSLYEGWTLSEYNVLFTFVPVILYGWLDRDVDEAMVYDYPQLYQSGLEKYHVNILFLLKRSHLRHSTT
jgi:phospholipid-transporting ATPase